MNKHMEKLKAGCSSFYFCAGLAVALAALSVVHVPALADDDDDAHFRPGNLLVSRSVYDSSAVNIVAGSTLLPPGCTGSACVAAVAGSAYPQVWNNDTVDGSFGITSTIALDQLTRSGQLVSSVEVPNNLDRHDHGSQSSDQMVTSFSSKSEIALNLSSDKRFVTFMGYLAPVGALDVSNSNTPDVVDPTNPVSGQYYRVVAEIDEHGKFHFTKSNAYSGNNGRAAVLNDDHGAKLLYMVGNAGNGGNPQPNGIIIGAGAQIATAQDQPLSAQADPGLPTPVGSFNITQLGDKADKIGKDTNFRGLTFFNNVVYVTKGSGGNGINTVYFIDTSGYDSNNNPLACPSGVGLPNSSATAPKSPIVYNAALLQTKGVFPYNMCVLKGFPTTLAKSTTSFPFGVWFANPTTVYVTDEGDGTNTFDPASGTYTAAAAQTTAGLQKWVFDAGQGAWKLAYVVNAGLGLGKPYTVNGYPTGNNAATGLPWAPATDGLRNLTGQINHDGTVTIWAITSTVSGNGDQGADPNRLVTITDKLAATSPVAGESFSTRRTARSGEVLRGVSFTPGTDADHDHDHDQRAER